MSQKIRIRLDEGLKTDADFNAFCFDEFPQVAQQFANGMDRSTRVNLLFQMAGPEDVAQRLEAWLLTIQSRIHQPDSTSATNRRDGSFAADRGRQKAAWGRIFHPRRGIILASVPVLIALLIGVMKLMRGAASKPIVVLMDSPLPDVVFSASLRTSGGTNSDDIINVLRGLPVEFIKESTSLEWLGDDRVREYHPKLIIIHLSCFYRKTNVFDSDQKFRSFLYGMAHTDIQFLVYTRGLPPDANAELRRRWDTHMETISKSELQGRVHLFIVESGDQADFANPATARRLIHDVRQILAMPNAASAVDSW